MQLSHVFCLVFSSILKNRPPVHSRSKRCLIPSFLFFHCSCFIMSICSSFRSFGPYWSFVVLLLLSRQHSSFVLELRFLPSLDWCFRCASLVVGLVSSFVSRPLQIRSTNHTAFEFLRLFSPPPSCRCTSATCALPNALFLCIGIHLLQSVVGGLSLLSFGACIAIPLPFTSFPSTLGLADPYLIE